MDAMGIVRAGVAALAAALAISSAPALAAAVGGGALADGGGYASSPEESSGGLIDLGKRPRRARASMTLSDGEPPSARTEVPARGKVYRVGGLDELRLAVQRIAQSQDAEATVRLTADVAREQAAADEPFAGVPGKLVMLSSDEGAVRSILLASRLEGGVVLDDVSASVSGGVLFACAQRFETTDRFAGSLGTVYGGGPAGADVAGDVDIVLRGGRVSSLFGGGWDSDVDGSVHIAIDAPTAPGAIPAHTVGGLYGGGRAQKTGKGRISGDVTIDFLSGSNGEFFGGGVNEFDPDAEVVANPAAEVSGTVTVNFGYKGAPAKSVWPGTAMFSYAGSVYSTVGNVRLNLLDGCSGASGAGDRDFYACGINDTVRGTVDINVDGFDANASFVRFGGDVEANQYYADGNIRILNEEDRENAVHVRWSTPMEGLDGSAWCGIQGSNDDIPTTIAGDVLVDVESGYLAFVKLDAEDGGTVIEGDSAIRVSGDAKIAQVEGNAREHRSDSSEHRTRAEVVGAGATIGYFYHFDEVHVTDAASVLVDGAGSVFPMFDETQNPFYSTLDLRVDSGAHLTTRDSSTKLQRDVVMEGGTWHAKGYVYIGESMDTRRSTVLWDTYSMVGKNHSGEGVATSMGWTSVGDTVVMGDNAYLNQVYGAVDVEGGTWSLLNSMKVGGDFHADGLRLNLPVVDEGSNYPSAWIPLAIEGVASGRADVVTVSRGNVSDPMDASAWGPQPVVPTLGENYITSSAPGGVGDGAGQDLPIQATFTLAKEVRGPVPYYLKRLPDADEGRADTHYMWQVAAGEPEEPAEPSPGGQELPDPPAPQKPAQGGVQKPAEGPVLPTTGDSLSIPLLAGIAAAGAVVIALGVYLRSRGTRK